MSEENVDFVKTMFAAGSGMDKQALLAVLPEFIEQTCDPEIEWIEDPQRAHGRNYPGHEGVRESWEQWLHHWEEWGFELERVVDCGFRDGNILRYREFNDEADAREAASLLE